MYIPHQKPEPEYFISLAQNSEPRTRTLLPGSGFVSSKRYKSHKTVQNRASVLSFRVQDGQVKSLSPLPLPLTDPAKVRLSSPYLPPPVASPHPTHTQVRVCSTAAAAAAAAASPRRGL